MTEHELDLLEKALYRHLALNVPLWKELGVDPEAPDDPSKTPGFPRWRRANFRSMYEANRRLITAAETHLNDLGYKTTSIRSATPGTVSVRVANAGSWRLCVRVPKEIAERIIILGFVPRTR